MSQHRIRRATLKDLDAIKVIADSHRHELGFVRRIVLQHSIEQGELLVANGRKGILGFVHYHHRLDKQTTLHNIAVRMDARGQGVGHALFNALNNEAAKQAQTIILLRCPDDLDANKFYFHLGMRCVQVEGGKRRRLKVWRKRIATAE